MSEPHGAEKGARRITDWPLRWPLNLFCSHPSTSGFSVQQEDGSWCELDVACLRCGRVIPPRTPAPTERGADA